MFRGVKCISTTYKLLIVLWGAIKFCYFSSKQPVTLKDQKSSMEILNVEENVEWKNTIIHHLARDKEYLKS